jgi:hypothetical protein
MAVMKLDKAQTGMAPVTGAYAGQVITQTGKINLASLTTHANADVVACCILPAYHRLVDFTVSITGDYDTGSSATLDFGILDEAEDGTVDTTILTACPCGTAGLTYRMGVATYGVAAATALAIDGYYAANRPVGMYIREHSNFATSGTIFVIIQYAPIDGSETIIAAD